MIVVKGNTTLAQARQLVVDAVVEDEEEPGKEAMPDCFAFRYRGVRFNRKNEGLKRVVEIVDQKRLDPTSTTNTASMLVLEIEESSCQQGGARGSGAGGAEGVSRSDRDKAGKGAKFHPSLKPSVFIGGALGLAVVLCIIVLFWVPAHARPECCGGGGGQRGGKYDRGRGSVSGFNASRSGSNRFRNVLRGRSPEYAKVASEEDDGFMGGGGGGGGSAAHERGSAAARFDIE